MITMDTSLHNARVQKLVRCNHCKQVIHVSQCGPHAKDCVKRKQSKRLDKMTMERDGLRMHAIACARYRTPTQYDLEIHYVHAEDVNHARAQFCYAEPDRVKARILGVSLVIGWNVDEKERVLIH